jgi:hypothetical protein
MNYYKYDGVWEEILVWLLSILGSAFIVGSVSVAILITIAALLPTNDREE